MTVYSKKLAEGFVVGAGTTGLYAAPSTGVIVVRDVVLSHNDTALRSIIIYSASGGQVSELMAVRADYANVTWHQSMRQVLDPGETLTLVTTSTGQTFYRISGYQLGL